MIRLFLALWMALAGAVAPIPRLPDPDLAMAMAAGALCMAEPGGEAPSNAHLHCQACLATTSAALPPRGPRLPPPGAHSLATPTIPTPQPVPDGSWPAYASRAPPAPHG